MAGSYGEEMANRRAILAAFLVVAAAGCGSEDRAATEHTTTDSIVVRVQSLEPVVPTWPPSEGTCFVATERLEVMLVVAEDASPGLCTRLETYLPEDAGLASRFPDGSEDETPSVVCDVGREGIHIDVTEILRDRTRLDPLAICDAIVRDGWELLPLDENAGVPLSEDQDGLCFSATRRFALQVYGESQRGQAFCDDVSQRYFPDPIAQLTLPVPDDPSLLADRACELERGNERVQILTFHGPRATAARICRSLERDGWRLPDL